METAHELNFLLILKEEAGFYVLHCYGVEAAPGVNVGDWGRGETGKRHSLQQQGRIQGKPFLGLV